jgi:hypothetical protein
MRDDDSPYRELLACLRASRDYRLARQAREEIGAAVAPRLLRRKVMPMAELPAEKQAADGDPKNLSVGRDLKSREANRSTFLVGLQDMYRNVGVPVLEATVAGSPSNDEREAQAMEALISPEHEMRLREIRSKAMLSDLMANDPIVSSHEPEAVVNAFNEMQRLAPRVLSEPAVARALLRKHLSQGGVDAHELRQLADTELAVRRAREPVEPVFRSATAKGPGLLSRILAASKNKG